MSAKPTSVLDRGHNPTATVLQHSSSRKWDVAKDVTLSCHDTQSLPKNCYIFLHKTSYPEPGRRREQLLAQFNIPDFVSNRTCTDLNGYFGSRTCSNGHEKVESCSTWFRCLVKMVRKVRPEDAHESGPEYVQDGKKYTWYEMGVFTRWDYPDQCRVLCVDTPEHLDSELQTALAQQPPLDFRDPSVMHRYLIDQIIVLYDISVWRVRDPVRQIERSRKNAGQKFDEMHEMARHGIHVSEVLEASIQTLEAMQSYHAVIRDETLSSNCYRLQANEYAKFQIQSLRSLKLRSQSNDKRLENEIQLAFNVIAHSDNTVMKSITILTMIFLPATFISSIFSMTFFSFDDNIWEISDKFWMYWAVALPSTLLVIALYILFSNYPVQGVSTKLPQLFQEKRSDKRDGNGSKV